MRIVFSLSVLLKLRFILQVLVNGMVFNYIYTLSKQWWHFSLRESKAHIAMDIFYIYKTDTGERMCASCCEPSMIPHYLIFCRSVSQINDTASVYTSN